MRKDRIFIITPITIKSQPGARRAKSSAHSIHEDKEPFRASELTEKRQRVEKVCVGG